MLNFFENEEKILKFWKENRIFERSISNRSKDNPASFYDGPPFVTGVPHYGHLLGSIAKDIIPRYLTMKGKRVRRVWGWDCHGLPIENKVEKKLGLKNRRDIEKIGLLKFINECKSYVAETSAEWNWYVDHIGRWVDMDHAYRTMDLDYMESVIWAFKQLYDKGLIYKGLRISLFCPRCSTPVSNFEIAMDNSYADREDTAITMKFKVIDETFLKKHKIKKPCYLLAWTTTPWSCVSVMGLAIGPKFSYQLVESSGECFLITTKRVKEVMAGCQYKIIRKLSSQEINGLKYEHLYDYYHNRLKDFKTYPAAYVSNEEGTGIVTINGAFGDVDMESSQKYGLPIIVNVDEEGKFTEEVKVAAGVYIKDAEKLIIDDLKNRNLLFKEEKIIHSYPFCYRCETPLIYRGQDSWFIDVQKLKPRLFETNKKIHWVPEHFKNGRFKEGIKTAPDWCISRTRYWATAMPIWQCDKCGGREVFGSIAEIEKRSGQKVMDLHRPFIDEIKFPCQKGDGTMIRVKDVLDCWLDSGSMPYAERHYPFANKEEFEKSFPADYISEYTGQVRAWFYVLHVLANALFHSHAFKNVVVSGVIMGTDGRKMSKSFHNFPDPAEVIKKYGGDALRLYLMGSPTMAGLDMNISEEGVKEQIKKILLIYWNCLTYYLTFAEVHHFDTKTTIEKSPSNVLDIWILSRSQKFLKNFTQLLDDYHIPEAVRLVPEFLDDLSRWYIRRSRDRFKEGDQAALATLYRVLMLFTKTTAPLIPFITETVYQKLGGEKKSVHLEDWPVAEESLISDKAEEKMRITREIAALILAKRAEKGIKVRQPLSLLIIDKKLPAEYLKLLKDELNIKEIRCGKKMKLETKITAKLKEEGLVREIVRQIQKMRKSAGLVQKDVIELVLSIDNSQLEKIIEKWSSHIKKETITHELIFDQLENQVFLAQTEITVDEGKIKIGLKVSK